MSEQKHLRIFISGCSGVGKTTLCKAMAEVLGIEYVSTSASKLWNEFRIRNHEDALRLAPSYAYKYQARVHDARVNALRPIDGPVITDRGVMDQLIYLRDYQMVPKDRDILIHDIMEDFYQDLVNYECVFIKVLRPFDWVNEDNGKRIVDEFYQVNSNMMYSGFDFRMFLKPELRGKYYQMSELGSPLVYLKKIGIPDKPQYPVIHLGGIYTKVLKKRMLGILQLLVNSGNLEEERFKKLFDTINKGNYEPKRYI